MNLNIIMGDQVVGKIKPDGFYSDDERLSLMLVDMFDGRGAEVWKSTKTDEGIADSIASYVKPGEKDFESLMMTQLTRRGYVLAMVED